MTGYFESIKKNFVIKANNNEKAKTSVSRTIAHNNEFTFKKSFEQIPFKGDMQLQGAKRVKQRNSRLTSFDKDFEMVDNSYTISIQDQIQAKRGSIDSQERHYGPIIGQAPHQKNNTFVLNTEQSSNESPMMSIR